MWFRRLKYFILSMGFKGTISNPSLFVRIGHHRLYFLVYVDDMIVLGSCKTDIDEFLRNMGNEFAVKQLGELDYFLGIQVHRTGGSIFLDQQHYLVNLLKKTMAWTT